MVHKLRGRDWHPARVAGRAMVAALAWAGLAASLPAEPPPVHYHHAGVMPPGAIGSRQLQRGGPLPGYFQPVEIRAPRGARVSTAEAGQFADPQPAPLKLGLLIGSVYRLRVTGIPLQEGMEVYPTIEVIDRTYPPVGTEFTFPIPIELAQEELEMALDGKFVTRVIYLEEPAAASPAPQQPGEQPYFEVSEGDNPLDVADSLGRPVAILRMGARVPDASGPDERFMYGSPLLVKWHPRAAGGVEPLGPLVRNGRTSAERGVVTASARVPIRRGRTAR
jgi:hypothetical protein